MSYMNREEEIKLKILGENEINKVISLIIPKIESRLKTLLGVKIQKVNYCLKKDVAEEIEQFLKEKREQIKLNPFKKGDYVSISHLYLNPTSYDLSLKISICFNGGKYEDNTYYCSYYSKDYYICSMENCQIKNFYKEKYEESKYIDSEQMIKQIEKCKKLKAELEEEKDKLNPYGLRDYV